MRGGVSGVVYSIAAIVVRKAYSDWLVDAH